MAAEETDKVKVLRVAVDELRRVHEHVSNAYDQLKLKILAMLAGQVAILTFIFSGDAETRIKVPTEPAAQIFLVGGAFAMLASFTLFVYLIASSRGWPVPGDMNEIEQIDNGSDNRYETVEKFLLFLKKDYLDGTRECINVLGNKAKNLILPSICS